MSKTSKAMREDERFMRNRFESTGKYGFAIIQRQEIDLSNIQLVACCDTRANDCEVNKHRGVHFFVDDYRFNGIYDHPEKSLARLAQYAYLLTPDFSTYADMPLWRQIENIGKNRWVGAYWQSKGLKVITTVTWSTPRSYEFCFDAVERNSAVAVGMIGCKREKKGFLNGYAAMLERIEPSEIIVFGSPFPEMKGNIIPVDYRSSRKVVRHGR